MGAPPRLKARHAVIETKIDATNIEVPVAMSAKKTTTTVEPTQAKAASKTVRKKNSEGGSIL